MEANNDPNANPEMENAAQENNQNGDNEPENRAGENERRAAERNNDDDENNNNNNAMVDMEVDEDEDDNENENDSTLDGGVALDTDQDASKAKKHSSECDLILYIFCDEPIDVAPDHPIMRPGVTVSIGLDKTTKLHAVFQRYVDFCNTSVDADTSGSPRITLGDVEFSFCQLLSGNDTAETSALMKNDRIRVRKNQTIQRVQELEQKRAYREADREYFRQMRHLMPESCPAKIADVVLDCRGKLVDKNGRNQRVLSTTVRAHSSLIGKRCPWLMDIITRARQSAKRQAEEEEKRCETPGRSPTFAAEIENDEDAENCLRLNEESNNNGEADVHDNDETISGSAQIDVVDDSSYDGKVNVIVMDEDEYDEDEVVSSSRHQIQSQQEANLLRVILPDHSPEAVKILLEYCYTNRVVSLGYDAFVHACKTRPTKHNGPVHPYGPSAKRWPNSGIPLVDFSVALAGMKLAEEAGMHRLSLMCETSAAQLVSVSTVVEALTISSQQKQISGNDLPILRRAAMKLILGRGRRGVHDIGRSSFFKRALEEESAIIVPTLFQGTMEVVTQWEKSKNGRRSTFDISDLNFKDLDREDLYKRTRERKRRRREKEAKDIAKSKGIINEDYLSDLSADDEYDQSFPTGQIIEWAHVAHPSKRAFARMARHNIDAAIHRQAHGTSMNSTKSSSCRRRSSRNSSSRSKGYF